MNRRNFFGGIAAVTATVPVLGSNLSEDQLAEVLPDVIGWRKKTVIGEVVEYFDKYCPSTDTLTFYGRWVDVSHPHKLTYALAARMPCREVFAHPKGWEDKKDTVKDCLKNTIYIKKRGIHVYSQSAPLKPEGYETALI